MPTGYTGIYANWNIDDGDPWDFGGDTDDPELRAPPNALPTFSSTAVQLTIAEDAAVGSDVGAAVTATDSDSATLVYKLVGAGVVAFDIVSATGQLQVGAALDHETAGSYTVTVQASDGKSVAFKDVTVTVTDVDEPPTLSGGRRPSRRGQWRGVRFHVRRGRSRRRRRRRDHLVAGGYGQQLLHDRGRQTELPCDSRLRGFESRRRLRCDRAGRRRRPGQPLTLAVTATVVNTDEAGVVSLSTTQPEKGVALTATLSDPDGSVSGLTWQWARATSTNGAWTDISGETSASYTPGSDDAAHYLRATASYDDAEGSEKSAGGSGDAPNPGIQVELIPSRAANLTGTTRGQCREPQRQRHKRPPRACVGLGQSGCYLGAWQRVVVLRRVLLPCQRSAQYTVDRIGIAHLAQHGVP